MKAAGFCEWHGGYKVGLKLITTLDNGIFWRDDAEKTFYENPFYACFDCREILSSMLGVMSVNKISPTEIKKNTFDIFKDSKKDIVVNFLNLKNIFPHLVSAIYIVPPEEFSENSSSRNKINIVVEFSGFTLLGYTRWAAQERKSGIDLWNVSKDRTKFWSTKLLRILIALGKIQKTSKCLNIWVKSYVRIVSIETLTNTPPEMIQTSPTKLFKLTE